MARVAIKQTAKPKARSIKTGSSQPKLGPPLGSKNRGSVASQKAASPSTRSTASRKAAPAAPKLNEAEMEVQLAKLERLVARLREQNKELKAIVESAEAPKQAIPETKPARRVSKSAPATRTRKPRVSKTVDVDVTVKDDNASE